MKAVAMGLALLAALAVAGPAAGDVSDYNDVPLGYQQQAGMGGAYPAHEYQGEQFGAGYGKLPVQPAANRLGGHLRDLGKSGIDSTRRAYQEAKPALNNIRDDLGDVVNRVRSNPRVAKVVEATRPRVMSVVSRAQPYVDRSGKRLSELASRANQRLQQRLAQRQPQPQSDYGGPEPSVYAVPPPPPPSYSSPAGY